MSTLSKKTILLIYIFFILCLYNKNGVCSEKDSVFIFSEYEKALVLNDWKKASEIIRELFPDTSETNLLQFSINHNGLSPKGRALVFQRLSDIYLNKIHNPQKAKTYIKSTLGAIEVFSQVEKQHIYLLASDVYEDLSSYDSSLYYLQKVIDVPSKDTLPLKITDLLNRKANLKNRLNEYDSALYVYKQSIDIGVNNSDTTSLANSYHGLAYAFRKKGQIDSSAYYEYKSLRLSEKSSYQRGIYLSLQSLAILSYIQKENAKSVSLAKQLVLKVKDTDEKSILANTYNLIGVNYGVMAKYDSALYFHKLALDIKKEMGNPGLITSSLNNIAAIYLYQNMPDSALTYLLEIKPIMENELRDSVNLSTLYSNIGTVYRQKDQPKMASEYFTLSANLAKKMKAHKQQIVALSGHIIVDTLIRDYKLAFFHQAEMQNVKEELLNIQKQTEVSRIREEFETEKKEEQLKVSQEQLALEKKINSSKTKMIYGAVIAILILCVLLIILWKLYLSNKKLRLKNELLLSEQNHRIKNNLQMVSNLLSLQSKTINSPEGKAALEDGQNRIGSVTLLHKMLYKENNYSDIKFSQYIHALCEEIKASVDRDINITINIAQEINIPIEKILSIGILINELVMNSVKHVEKSIRLDVEINIKSNPTLILNYSDNGQGIALEQWVNSTSFGNRLIRLQSEQLNSKYSISSEKGFNFQLIMQQN